MDFATILKIEALFKRKSWPVEPTKPTKKGRFNKFCRMMEALSFKEQELMFILTEKFEKISMSEYTQHVINCLDKIAVNLVNDNVYICALVKPSEVTKPKSGTMLAYMFHTEDIKEHILFDNRKIFVRDFCSMTNDFDKNNSTLILVDDFIGSGKTACSALKHVIEVLKIAIDNIIVLSIAILKSGVVEIKKTHIPCYYSIIQNKAISDNFVSPIANDYMNILIDIGRKIKINKRYYLGFANSEALISMERTPNNTLPIFWAEPPYCKNNTAPFAR